MLGGLFVGSLWIGWVLSGRVLRPVRSIARTAQEIQATDLSRVDRATTRMTRLVEDLLATTRRASGAYGDTDVDLAVLAREEGEEFDQLAAARELTIEYRLGEGLEVIGDPVDAPFEAPTAAAGTRRSGAAIDLCKTIAPTHPLRGSLRWRPAAMDGQRRTTLATPTLRLAQDRGAAELWRGAASGAELLRRVRALPGFGEQKARIFVVLLGKQLSVRPEGWREAAGAYGMEGTHRSVADVTDPESLAQVRAFKQAAKRATAAGS